MDALTRRGVVPLPRVERQNSNGTSNRAVLPELKRFPGTKLAFIRFRDSATIPQLIDQLTTRLPTTSPACTSLSRWKS